MAHPFFFIEPYRLGTFRVLMVRRKVLYQFQFQYFEGGGN